MFYTKMFIYISVNFVNCQSSSW